MTIENLGWFFLGAGCVILGVALARLRSKIKFTRYIDKLEAVAARLRETNSNEVSELQFRDKSGKLCKVLIVIDHSLDDKMSEEERAKIRAMVLSGMAHPLDELIQTSKDHEEDMNKVHQFVFSGHTASVMREQGIEPDEIVIKMLKASGRIA